MKVTPNIINKLGSNEVFVFGSNLQGMHAGGAAKCAVQMFGAKMGQPVGMQGQSYAIPTLSFAAFKKEDLDSLKLPIPVIGEYVNKFIQFAKGHPDMFFYVTPIGCGIAGFTEQQMAPLFKECMNMDNVALPESFISILGGQPETNEEPEKEEPVTDEPTEINESIVRRIVSNIVKQML